MKLFMLGIVVAGVLGLVAFFVIGPSEKGETAASESVSLETYKQVWGLPQTAEQSDWAQWPLITDPSEMRRVTRHFTLAGSENTARFVEQWPARCWHEVSEAPRWLWGLLGTSPGQYIFGHRSRDGDWAKTFAEARERIHKAEEPGVFFVKISPLRDSKRNVTLAHDHFSEEMIESGPICAKQVVEEGQAIISTEHGVVQGYVREMLVDRSAGKSISGATITFEDSENSFRRVVMSKDGKYSVNLPYGSYRVRAAHHRYQSYSTESDFLIISDLSARTFNIQMMVRGGLYCPANGKFPLFVSLKISKVDAPPRVSISTDKKVVKVGEAFKVSLRASDDKGVSSMWWWGENTGDVILDEDHHYGCNARRVCKREWSVSATRPGKFVLSADAVDTAYGTMLSEAHQVSTGRGVACTGISVIK